MKHTGGRRGAEGIRTLLDSIFWALYSTRFVELSTIDIWIEGNIERCLAYMCFLFKKLIYMGGWRYVLVD